MPYPNEHAARIKEPGLFITESFRRKLITTGVSLISGKLKDGNGSMVAQAYRFNINNFTAQQAKDWLKEHDIKYISFEKATNGKWDGEDFYCKDYSTEIKEIGTEGAKGIVLIYVSAFGNKDSDGDIMQPTAFNRSIKNNFNRIKHLKNHYRDQLLGFPLKMTPDDKGLLVESAMNLENPLPKETFSDYLFFKKGGRTLEHSIGYRVIKQSEGKDDQGEPANLLHEVKLFEYSTLSFLGANEMTPLSDLKNIKNVDDFKSLLENIYNLQYNNEYLTELEGTLEKLQSNYDTLKNSFDTLQSTLKELLSTREVKQISDVEILKTINNNFSKLF